MSNEQDDLSRTRLPQPLLALLRRGAAAAGAAAVIATAVPAASGQDAPLDNDSVEQTETDESETEETELSVQEIEERVRLKLDLYGPQPVHVVPIPGVPPHGNGWDPCPPCGMG